MLCRFGLNFPWLRCVFFGLGFGDLFTSSAYFFSGLWFSGLDLGGLGGLVFCLFCLFLN